MCLYTDIIECPTEENQKEMEKYSERNKVIHSESEVDNRRSQELEDI